ncbi:clan AA aspartic protease [Candidatus Poribacteria bacterium]|nr:clan AA aspartic protease [Candidatus Poribacteria bacterium]
MSQTRFELSPDRLIMVQATIHALDYSKHVTVDLILDTGASYTTINPGILSDLGYDLSDPNLHKIDFITASGNTKASIIPVSKLCVIGHTFEGMEVAANYLPVDTYAHGLLGANFLSCLDISISYSKHTIHTEPISSLIYSFTP